MNTEVLPVRLVRMENGETWFFALRYNQWQKYKKYDPIKLIEGNDLILKVTKE